MISQVYVPNNFAMFFAPLYHCVLNVALLADEMEEEVWMVCYYANGSDLCLTSFYAQKKTEPLK
jgi:hypothetical protein